MSDPALHRMVNRVYGAVVAIVVDNKDPEGRYRVKVKYPWVLESDGQYTDQPDEQDFVSNWARISSLFAGSRQGGNFRGAFFLPEVDDEVLVVFEHGDVRRPILVGSLWNGVDKPIHDNGAQGGKNNFRSIRSRSGHMFTFHDDDEGKVERIILQTKCKDGEEDLEPMERDGHLIVIDHSDGAEKIQIYDRKKTNYVLIDSTNDHIEVKSAEGDISILAPQGKVLIDCKELETHSSTTTTMKADSDFKAQAGGNMDLTAGSTMTEKAQTIKLN